MLYQKLKLNAISLFNAVDDVKCKKALTIKNTLFCIPYNNALKKIADNVIRFFLYFYNLALIFGIKMF